MCCGQPNTMSVESRGMCYAHTLEGKNEEEWEPLEAHLRKVAELAAGFSTAFAADEWGRLAGMWHDLGKYSAEFQAYLRKTGRDDAVLEDQPGRVDHSSAGAQHAASRLGTRGEGLILAYAIAGHHAGLPDWDDGISQAGLRQRLQKCIASIDALVPHEVFTAHEGKVPPLHLQFLHPEQRAFRLAFWVRMLFSALVDADFLATEAFMDPSRSATRPSDSTGLERLGTAIDAFLECLKAGSPDTTVNRIRREILDSCRARAVEPPGFFSLTVPTGGGKTLASMVFALRHACKHSLRRVIVAVPFTSIIEQNADVYRAVFAGLGEDIVLEHHSNLDTARESQRSRLAAENWDAPVVVTTNVQLLESLFACRTSRCRKLHRIARSVIVLDEAQTLPVDLLAPSLAALRELVDSYGCSIVLSSATQPALQHRGDFSIGIQDVREIVVDPGSLHERLRRNRIRWEGALLDTQLVERLESHPQVLCVVNTRPHAATLFGRIAADPATYHLSTRMCASHRAQVLSEIRGRLVVGQRCRVVSTQLVEAGVDIDFPVVYRALAGLDSIAQAAGRCNREGQRASGEVFVFAPEAPIPAGHLRQTADTTRELLTQFSDDLSAPEAIRRYFELHYWKKSDAWDRHQIGQCFSWGAAGMHFQYRQAAERFRLIDEMGTPVVVPWGDAGKDIADHLLAGRPPDRALYRKMQRFLVHVRPHELGRLEEQGAIALAPAVEGLTVLTGTQSYDPRSGLRLDVERAYAAEDLVV